MMGDISIRSMSQEDAQEMCSWEYSGQYRVYNNSWEKMEEQGISYADEETRRKEFYTLLRDGKMIGFFRLRRGEKVVELGLGLRPDVCGQGLGKELVQAAVQEHKKRFGDLPLWLAVRVWNERAIRCYRTCGFVEIKRLTLELSEGPTEFIRMEYRDDETFSYHTQKVDMEKWARKHKSTDENLMNLPVLVVDDDKTCCESTVATLKEIGITGEWVLSGREAVERCYARHELKNDYFAVILDWKMPDMDGIETARQIRKRIGKEITIIVLTSYEFSEIEEDAKAAGVDAFIAKPLFRSRLTATLRQFVSDKKEKTARNYLENLSEADYTGKRILLVEDNELNREIAVEILQMTGAEVETAENGKIAVEKVEVSPKDRYDLIFMDIQMPVLNGYQATAAIRSLPGEKGELPIVAMTANAFAEDVQLAKNTGMNGHIAKPLDMNKLSDVLKKWL